MSKLYFLDCEASSLSSVSYPIEIGWVDENGQGESHLIKPAADWSEWSPDSERVHGIRRETLQRQGTPHEQVARRAAAVLAPERALVFADQPAWDGEWLRVLLQAAGIGGQISVLNAIQLYRQACRPLLQLSQGEKTDAILDLAQQIVTDSQNAERQRQRARHRALPDAEGLRWVWKDVQERVALAMKQAGQ
jgi:hypothetical protein